MIVYCAWHVQNFGAPFVIGEKEGPTEISHGICPDCDEKLRIELRVQSIKHLAGEVTEQ